MSDTALRIALVDPFDLHIAEDLRFALGKDIQVVVSPTEQIEERIKRYYGTDTSSMEEMLKQLGEAGEALPLRETDGEAAVEAEANATPIIRFVDLILYQAIQDRASDIHFEPFENEFKIRYRVDGALYEMSPPPRHLALAGDFARESDGKHEHRRDAGCRRMGAFRRTSRAAMSICGFQRCRRNLAKASCCACWIAASSISTSKRSACPITSTITCSK